MDKALNYLALARKGRMCELGEEPVGAIARTGKAYVILVAGDASDHTWRRAKSYAAGTDQQCIRLSCTKDEMGLAVGRTSLAIAAFTDASMALAFVKALDDQQRYQEALEKLDVKSKKLRQRQDEAKAHQRNVRTGKRRHEPDTKKD